MSRGRRPSYGPAEVTLATLILELEEGSDFQRWQARVLWRFLDGRSENQKRERDRSRQQRAA